MSGKSYRCGNEPCTCGYEDARKVLVARLREIGAEDSRNGYAKLADDIEAGIGRQVDSWIAMELIADASPPPPAGADDGIA